MGIFLRVWVCFFFWKPGQLQDVRWSVAWQLEPCSLNWYCTRDPLTHVWRLLPGRPRWPWHCWISAKLAQEEWYFPTLFQSIQSLRKSLFLPCIRPALARQGLSAACYICSPGTLGLHVKLGHGLALAALLQQVVRGQLLTSSGQCCLGGTCWATWEKGHIQWNWHNSNPNFEKYCIDLPVTYQV